MGEIAQGAMGVAMRCGEVGRRLDCRRVGGVEGDYAAVESGGLGDLLPLGSEPGSVGQQGNGKRVLPDAPAIKRQGELRMLDRLVEGPDPVFS